MFCINCNNEMRPVFERKADGRLRSTWGGCCNNPDLKIVNDPYLIDESNILDPFAIYGLVKDGENDTIKIPSTGWKEDGNS